MSKKLTDLTIDMTKLRRMPVQERLTFAKQPGVASDIFGNLTPSQIASLFPKYYMDKNPAMSGMMKATSSSYSGGGSGGGGSSSYSSGGTSGGNSSGSSSSGGGYTPKLSLTQRLAQAAGIDQTGSSVNDPRVRKVLQMISKAEGTASYDTQFGNQNISRQAAGGKPITQMTINEVRELMANTPKNSRAMGKYQFVPDTFNEVVAGLGLSGNELFSPEMQDKMIVYRLNKTRGMDDFLNGKITKEQFSENLAQEFASFPSIANGGNALYGGVGNNSSRPLVSVNEVLGTLDDAYKTPTATPPNQSDATKPGETTNQNTNGTTDIATTNLPTDNPNGNTANVTPVPAFQFDVTKLNPDLQAEYNHASESEKKTIEQAVQKIGYDKANEIRNENPTASPSLATAEIKKEGEIEKIKPVVFSQEGLQEFWKGRNPRGGDLQQVDPVLLKSYAEAAQQYEAANPNYRVEIFGPNSGTRESGSTVNHGIKADGYGKALDFVIIDKATGRQIANKGSEGYAGQEGGSELGGVEYAKLHGMARVAQEHFFPNATPLRSGIGFVGGSVPFDAMHGDITGGGMAGFNWETGYTPQQMNNYNIPQNFALGDEKRIQALGNTIYGETDENGYYKNQGMYEYNPETNTNTISAKTSAETATATVVPPDQQPSTQPAPQVNEHQQPGTAENPPNDIAPTPLNTDPDVTPPQQPAANSGAATGQDPDVTPPPPQLSGGGVVPNSAQEPLEVRDKETGQVLAQVQPNEKLTTTPNGLKVDSASEIKADETMAETNKGDPVQQQQRNQGVMRGAVENPERTNPDKLSDLADMRTVIYSPSQARAMNQATLGGAAQHYNRGSNVG